MEQRETNMKIAISGKGGSGKTTLSATQARLFAREGFPVLAIPVYLPEVPAQSETSRYTEIRSVARKTAFAAPTPLSAAMEHSGG